MGDTSTSTLVEIMNLNPPSPYNALRIAWELDRTAQNDGYYGNALRVAKDIPGITDEDRATLDRWATGAQLSGDHMELQAIAIKIRMSEQEQPDSQPARERSM